MRSKEPDAVLDSELEELRQWLSKVKFRRVPFGGVDEADVWKKLDELNSLYEKLLLIQQTRQEGTGDCHE